MNLIIPLIIKWSLGMKKIVVLVLILSGCISTLSYEEELGGYKQHCKNIGFKKASEAFANCVLEQYKIAN